MENGKEFLGELKKTALSFDDKAEVILFGSRARGDYGEDSDRDVLVLTGKKLTPQTEAAILDRFFEIELGYAQAVSALVADKETWDYWEIRPLNVNVAKEGILL